MKTQNYSIGLFGWNAKLAPDRSGAVPYDQHRDIGIDGSYQFLGTRKHIATIHASYLRERAVSGETGDVTHLNESKLNLSYHYDNTWGATVGLFDTRGTDPAAATRGQILQLDWTPWGKEDRSAPAPFSWASLRLGAQWWRYSRFDGDTVTARDHDTLSVFAWTSF
jgi:hypothetical protein